jgi:exopolyphosphatase/guanosine-5'-triphosphate,3'-diphosphate pyrophosphatase
MTKGRQKPGRQGRRLPQDREVVLQAVLALSGSCPDHTAHMCHVERLVLQLFDGLLPLHRLGRAARFRLRCAALLHDIGWLAGRRGHHKASLRMILDTPLLPLRPRERLLVALVARYHRKALPGLRHGHYARLSPRDRREVRRLAGLLRVADALDVNHDSAVERVACTGGLAAERVRALARGGLLMAELKRGLVFTGRSEGYGG